ncbi:hypothetical protein [Streptomyces specialis]|uniref:hypothetical protein n=1 Tax=Streptomyces specialis TaxID=498367 RepID=UPI000B1DF0A2|nr:hypothetical protein [Streptomyces specialis]
MTGPRRRAHPRVVEFFAEIKDQVLRYSGPLLLLGYCAAFGALIFMAAEIGPLE